MTARWALAAFLALQGLVALAWVFAAGPAIGEVGAAGWRRNDAQLWSSSGPGLGGEMIDPFNHLLTATLLLLASAASAFMSRQDFLAGGSARACLYLGAGLGLAAIGVWLISAEWTKPLVFPAGFPDLALVFAATRAFIAQFFIGYLVLIVCLAQVAMGGATEGRPGFFHLAIFNWWVVVAAWVVIFGLFYALPML